MDHGVQLWKVEMAQEPSLGKWEHKVLSSAGMGFWPPVREIALPSTSTGPNAVSYLSPWGHRAACVYVCRMKRPEKGFINAKMV